MSNGFYRISVVDTADGELIIDEHWNSAGTAYMIEWYDADAVDHYDAFMIELTPEQFGELLAHLREYEQLRAERNLV